MDLVYSTADANLIYLGADEDGVAEGTIQFLQEANEYISKEVEKLDIPVEDKCGYEAYGLVSNDLKFRVAGCESNIQSLLPLYDLLWFQ
jgi:hypothetical protein